MTPATEIILSPPPKLAAIPIFAQTPKAERRFREFFTSQIGNENTRKSYFNAVRYIAAWCQSRNIAELHQVEPMHIAAYCLREVGRFPGRSLLSSTRSYKHVPARHE